MTRRMTLAVVVMSLAMLVACAWLTGSGSAAPKAPGASLVGGTIWWP